MLLNRDYPMKLNFEIEINSPIQNVWHSMAEDFANIHKWYGPIKNSYELPDTQKMENASCAGRVCVLTDNENGPKASELIKVYDKSNWLLELEVSILDAPAIMPFNSNYAIFQLKQISATQTLLELKVAPKLKAHGIVLYPLIKMGLSMEFKKLLRALKTHTEHLMLSAA